MKRGAPKTASTARRATLRRRSRWRSLDDLADRSSWDALHNGQLRAMRAGYVAERGVTVIRPLVYVREHAASGRARRGPARGSLAARRGCSRAPRSARGATEENAGARGSLPVASSNSVRRRWLTPLMDDALYGVHPRLLDDEVLRRAAQTPTPAVIARPGGGRRPGDPRCSVRLRDLAGSVPRALAFSAYSREAVSLPPGRAVRRFDDFRRSEDARPPTR